MKLSDRIDALERQLGTKASQAVFFVSFPAKLSDPVIGAHPLLREGKPPFTDDWYLDRRTGETDREFEKRVHDFALGRDGLITFVELVTTPPNKELYAQPMVAL
jgi:hypothetical protein